jgi:hypothetical protein
MVDRGGRVCQSESISDRPLPSVGQRVDISHPGKNGFSARKSRDVLSFLERNTSIQLGERFLFVFMWLFVPEVESGMFLFPKICG